MALALAFAAGNAGAADKAPCLPVPTTRPTALHAPVQRPAGDQRLIDTLRFDQNRSGIDFAGHFTLAQVGCGAGCLRLAAVDARSGRVFWFGSTITNWPAWIAVPLSYRRDSRLLGVLGSLDESGEAGWHWFDFDKAVFGPLPGPPAGCRPAPPHWD